jgi:hypothetical protein
MLTSALSERNLNIFLLSGILLQMQTPSRCKMHFERSVAHVSTDFSKIIIYEVTTTF